MLSESPLEKSEDSQRRAVFRSFSDEPVTPEVAGSSPVIFVAELRMNFISPSTHRFG
jgi:hypothetical protein